MNLNLCFLFSSPNKIPSHTWDLQVCSIIPPLYALGVWPMAFWTHSANRLILNGIASFSVFPPLASMYMVQWIPEWKCFSLLLCSVLELSLPSYPKANCSSIVSSREAEEEEHIAEGLLLRMPLSFGPGGAPPLSEREKDSLFVIVGTSSRDLSAVLWAGLN